ncbi:hypothetical protein ACFLQT_01420, partial [Bacteroidota bacterium]
FAEFKNLSSVDKNAVHASFIQFNNTSIPYSYTYPEIRTKKVALSGNLEQMKYFYQGLKSTSNTKIRIAHYGDSIILGDVITEYLREKFQKEFGGDGAGFLPIASTDNKMRRTVLHSFSDDWELTSIFTLNPEKLPLGLSSVVSKPGRKSWAEYSKTNFISSLGPFQMVRLFYSHANKGASVSYNYNGSEIETLSLSEGTSLKEEKINLSQKIYRIKLNFESCQNTFFYGVSLENGNGVYVDNFPITGNSGVSLVDIPLDLMRQFNSYLNYKLIILNFGVNVGAPNRGTYTFYENKMVKVIEHLKKAFPETSILIVSVSDRTVRRNGRLVTDSDIPLLLRSQKKIADKGGVAFWNLFESMGGINSMTTWVDSAPPMALKDYRHFTHDGGKIVAGLIFDTLMNDIDKY